MLIRSLRDLRSLSHKALRQRVYRDSAAIQVKLDELIRVSAAHNSFVGIEHLTDDELDEIRTKCERRAEAEKIGEETVKKTGKKAKRAADLVTE